MLSNSTKGLPLIQRIRWLRVRLPLGIISIVIIYQLIFARSIQEEFGHLVHYSVEIAFYSIVGPLITWLTLIWIERNLLEKNALEKTLHMQSEQLANLANSSEDAIISLNKKGKIISWNNGAKNMFGYGKVEIKGSNFTILLSDLSPTDERILKKGTENKFDTIAFHKNGHKIRVNLTQTLIENELEDVPVILIILRDITAQEDRDEILEEERGRIARDLHDEIAQTLYFLALKADLAKGQVLSDPTKAIDELETIGNQSRHIIQVVRQTIYALKPLNWEVNKFIPALKDFVEGFSEQLEWKIVLIIGEDVNIPIRLEPAVFRIVQESLNNVAKHAKASLVTIKIEIEEEKWLGISINDDGDGFSEAESGSNGLGLEQMKFRVNELGGILDIKGTQGIGTILKAKLPLPGK